MKEAEKRAGVETTIIGFPRLGAKRELKFALEGFFRGEVTEEAVRETAADLRRRHWRLQKEQGIGLVPVGDFSLYDGVLDTAVRIGAVPARYRALGLDPLRTYFAMARGYQGAAGDVKALSMKNGTIRTTIISFPRSRTT